MNTATTTTTVDYTEEQQDAVTEYFDALIESQTEYEETHTDAGDAYAHMPMESWIHDKELQTFIDDNEINTRGLDIDELAELYLEGFEMESEHMFSTRKDDVFQPFAYAIGEIEIQVELDVVAEELGVTVEQLTAIMVAEHIVHRAPTGDTCEVYGNSDMSWCANMTAEALQEAIDDKVDG